MKLPPQIKTVVEYIMMGGAVAFFLSGFWALLLLVKQVANFQQLPAALVEGKMVGNALDGIRLIGQNSLVSAGGNHVITVFLLGAFGVALIACKRSDGFFRWLWIFGWHEELWTLMLTLYYLHDLSLQWISPLVFSYAVIFIVASTFWGHLKVSDWLIVGLSEVFFIIWATVGQVQISSCISTAPFVVHCANTLSANLWEVGSWIYMIGLGFVIWVILGFNSISLPDKSE